MSGVTAATVATYATIAAAAATTYEAVSSSGQGKAPKVSTAAAGDITNSSNTTAARMSALLATQGGSAGQTLAPGTTSGKDTILGN